MLRIISALFALIIFAFCFAMPAFSRNHEAIATLTAVLPTIMSIESFYVDGREYSSNLKYPNLNINEVIKVDEELNILKLSPIQYKIKANTKNDIKVNASFIALTGPEYSFSQDKLSIQKRYTNNKNLPVTTKMSPEFIPTISVDPEVPPGIYNGTVLLTISAL